MTRPRLLTLALALLLVSAGCTGPRAPAQLGSEAAAASDSTVSAPEEAIADRPNPWGEPTLTVAVEAAGSDAHYVPLVREAAAFWSGNTEPYAGYAVDLRVDPNATDPDIVIRFVDTIDGCAGAKHPVGCAPVVRSEARRPAGVEIKTGLDDDSTLRVLKHEFGHTLGLTHGDAPVDVMESRLSVATVPKPNATDRTFPWENRTLDVYVATGADDGPAATAEVDRALRYVEASPDLPAVTFRRVDSEAAANVVIRLDGATDSDDCSCFRIRGPDPDRDGAPEQYRRLDISLRGVPTDQVAWRVGNWLSYGLGAEDRAERPAPFRENTPGARRAADWG